MPPGGALWAAVATQAFLPLSPSLCLLIYDPLAYELPEKSNRVIEASQTDVLALNQLQALQARGVVVLPDTYANTAGCRQITEWREAEAPAAGNGAFTVAQPVSLGVVRASPVSVQAWHYLGFGVRDPSALAEYYARLAELPGGETRQVFRRLSEVYSAIAAPDSDSS